MLTLIAGMAIGALLAPQVKEAGKVIWSAGQKAWSKLK